MRRIFYRLLIFWTRICGTWLFVVMARCIAAGYFLFCPRRVGAGMDFYSALFPQNGRWHALWCTWRQFQNFTSLFLDRFLLQAGHAIRFSFQGREHLLEAWEQKAGGIILMSHIGNWEIAAHLLHSSLPELPLMLYMGQREKDQIERLQKKDLLAQGIRVLAVDRDAASAFDLMEGISLLREGGFLSMAGDMLWHQGQKSVEVDFLEHRIRLPETPHGLALIAGVPLFVFLASRKAGGEYCFRICEPILVRAEDRSRRAAAIRQAAQTYAARMADHVRATPFEWYHFEPFLLPRGETIVDTGNI